MTSSSSSQPPTTMKLTYFDIEGAAEPIRLALALAGVEYTDERIKYPEWQALKPTTPYGQLPTLQMDTDSKTRAQSGALMRYIATTFAPEMLYPSASLLDIEEVIGLATDMSHGMEPMIYMSMSPAKYGRDKDFAASDEGKDLIRELRQTWLKTDFPKFCQYFERWLDANNGMWMASSGEMPTLADCVVVPLLRRVTKGYMDHIPSTVLDDYPKLTDYIKRFCALPQIQGRYTDGLY